MHDRGLMQAMHEGAARVHPAIALTPGVHYPLFNARVQSWLTLFIHTQLDFYEKGRKRRYFVFVNNQIFIEDDTPRND